MYSGEKCPYWTTCCSCSRRGSSTAQGRTDETEGRKQSEVVAELHYSDFDPRFPSRTREVGKVDCPGISPETDWFLFLAYKGNDVPEIGRPGDPAPGLDRQRTKRTCNKREGGLRSPGRHRHGPVTVVIVTIIEYGLCRNLPRKKEIDLPVEEGMVCTHPSTCPIGEVDTRRI